jgi:hypothetical protein
MSNTKNCGEKWCDKISRKPPGFFIAELQSVIKFLNMYSAPQNKQKLHYLTANKLC